MELRLDTSRELLKSPRKLSSDSKDIDRDEKRSSIRDDNEDLAEDFSDFGDSDDDILNQEESDSREGGELRDADSRSTSRLSLKNDSEQKTETGDMADFDRDDTHLTSANESEDTVKSNARLADALGADWSQLLQKERAKPPETGDARKRWSLAEIIRRNGLNQRLIGGKDKYDAFLEKLNKDLPEEDKVVLLDPRPWKHVALTRKRAQDKALFSDLGGCRALSARTDINIRRKLNGIRSEDTGLPVSRVNTNMELYTKAREMWQKKQLEIQKTRDWARESVARIEAAATS